MPSNWLVVQVLDKLKQTTSFALQLESTDIGGESYRHKRHKDINEDIKDINEHILFCKPMQSKTTGEDIFNVVDGRI